MIFLSILYFISSLYLEKFSQQKLKFEINKYNFVCNEKVNRVIIRLEK